MRFIRAGRRKPPWFTRPRPATTPSRSPRSPSRIMSRKFRRTGGKNCGKPRRGTTSPSAAFIGCSCRRKACISITPTNPSARARRSISVTSWIFARTSAAGSSSWVRRSSATSSPGFPRRKPGNGPRARFAMRSSARRTGASRFALKAAGAVRDRFHQHRERGAFVCRAISQRELQNHPRRQGHVLGGQAHSPDHPRIKGALRAFPRQ